MSKHENLVSDGNKLKKTHLIMFLQEWGVPFNSTNKNKQYYVELYNQYISEKQFHNNKEHNDLPSLNDDLSNQDTNTVLRKKRERDYDKDLNIIEVESTNGSNDNGEEMGGYKKQYGAIKKVTIFQKPKQQTQISSELVKVNEEVGNNNIGNGKNNGINERSFKINNGTNRYTNKNDNELDRSIEIEYDDGEAIELDQKSTKSLRSRGKSPVNSSFATEQKKKAHIPKEKTSTDGKVELNFSRNEFLDMLNYKSGDDEVIAETPDFNTYSKNKITAINQIAEGNSTKHFSFGKNFDTAATEMKVNNLSKFEESKESDIKPKVSFVKKISLSNISIPLSAESNKLDFLRHENEGERSLYQTRQINLNLSGQTLKSPETTQKDKKFERKISVTKLAYIASETKDKDTESNLENTEDSKRKITFGDKCIIESDDRWKKLRKSVSDNNIIQVKKVPLTAVDYFPKNLDLELSVKSGNVHNFPFFRGYTGPTKNDNSKFNTSKNIRSFQDNDFFVEKAKRTTNLKKKIAGVSIANPSISKVLQDNLTKITDIILDKEESLTTLLKMLLAGASIGAAVLAIHQFTDDHDFGDIKTLSQFSLESLKTFQNVHKAEICLGIILVVAFLTLIELLNQEKEHEEETEIENPNIAYLDPDYLAMEHDNINDARMENMESYDRLVDDCFNLIKSELKINFTLTGMTQSDILTTIVNNSTYSENEIRELVLNRLIFKLNRDQDIKRFYHEFEDNQGEELWKYLGKENIEEDDD